MNTDPEVELARAFGAYAAGGAGGDELGIALLVNKALDMDLDTIAVRARADALAHACPAGEMPWRYLEGLGFAGNPDDYANITNSRIDSVLTGRQGIPITLAVVLVHVARAGGHAASGINFPGHFLARIGDTLVDPFLMRDVSEQECLERLPERGMAGRPFETATPLMIGMRMLNNVKYQFAGGREWPRALAMLDHQLALAPHEARLHLERGELWLRAGSRDMARDAYTTALGLATDNDVRGAAETRLKTLGKGPDILH